MAPKLIFQRQRSVTSETPQKKKLFEASYSDMEGLLINVGVISALMLSIAIPLFSSFSLDDLVLADYRSMLLESPDFRKVVARELSKKMFDFNVSLGPDITFDVKAALELPRPSGDLWALDEVYSTYMETMEKVFHMTRDSVPKWIITTGATNVTVTLVANVRRCYVWSVTLFSTALLTALFLYVAITVSGYGEREDDGKDAGMKKKIQELEDAVKNKRGKNQEDIQHDQKDKERFDDKDVKSRSTCLENFAWVFTLILVGLMYISIIIACYIVLWGFMDVMRIRYPDLALTHAWLVHVGCIWGMTVPSITFLLSLAVFFLLQLGNRCCVNKVHQHDEVNAVVEINAAAEARR